MTTGTNRIGLTNRMRTDPIPVNRTTRPLMKRNLTSGNAGKMIPIMATGLLREDSVPMARFRVALQMDETVDILMNAVNVRVLTYLVPRLAFDRFDGWDSLNRAYEKQGPGPSGGTVPPWFESYTEPADPKTNEIHYTLGRHMKAGDIGNTDYIEAYNQIWNFRAKNRSPHLTLRNRLDMTLAPAFWNHQTWQYVVPDFDQAVIDGEVPLNIVGGKLPVKGIGLGNGNPPTAYAATLGIIESGSGGTARVTPGWRVTDAAPASQGQTNMVIAHKAGGGSLEPDVWAELSAGGTNISLSNIELARKTQAFAELRRRYNGHSDEYIIDLLMDGLSIPDAAWQQPILLSDQSTVFGMAKRWATDGASLTDSVVNGATFVDIGYSCPRVPCGGVIMTVVEIAPEQLFERQEDRYLSATDPDQLPHYLRDTLDPEKVEIVTNREVDVLHASPAATFGYAPLNHAWAKSAPSVGGRYYRPSDDAFVEARQRIWSVETPNPVLGRDFYLVTGMHYKPFVVSDGNVDHFEIMASGEISIRGNTVFGQALIEATDDYQKVLDQAPQDRIDKAASQATLDFEGKGSATSPGQLPSRQQAGRDRQRGPPVV